MKALLLIHLKFHMLPFRMKAKMHLHYLAEGSTVLEINPKSNVPEEQKVH